MDAVIFSIIEKYGCVTHEDYKRALKEIIQEIALLGLWRAKFYEHAAFYGGTALRILYGLDRFSEDLDFTLLAPNSKFSLAPYYAAIEAELTAFGFQVTVEEKVKINHSSIVSAFLKTDTKIHLLLIGAPPIIQRRCHLDERLKIKLEVDTNPPGGFQRETKYLLRPVPFYVGTLLPADLFAGKLHAVLCRSWKSRVKGRDWYDFLWFVGRGVRASIPYLSECLKQSGHYEGVDPLTAVDVKQRLRKRIEGLDIESAKTDVLPFIKNPQNLDVWSRELFLVAADQLQLS